MTTIDFTVRRFAKVLATGVLLAGCGNSAAEPRPGPSITGEWSGPFLPQSTITLHLIEYTGTVSGSGTMTTPALPSTALTIGGIHVHPDVELTIVPSGYQEVYLTGTVSMSGADSTIIARLDGSGFMNVSVTLTKQ